MGLGWVGLGWVGLRCVALRCVALGWVGLGWVGLGWVGLGLVGLGLGWVEIALTTVSFIHQREFLARATASLFLRRAPSFVWPCFSAPLPSRC